MQKKHSLEKQATETARVTIEYLKDPSLNYSRILASCTAKAYKRSAIVVKETGNVLKFEVSAKDVTALIASTNAVLRRLQVIASTRIR